jgi:GTPase SAR1 family protein
MVERLSDKLKEFLYGCQGKEVSLKYLREELRIAPNSSAWDGLRQYMANLTKEKIVKPTGRNDGTYKVIKQVSPIKVFGREKRPPVKLYFPRDYDTGDQMCIANDIIVREGDMILIAGRSNFGKTTLCMNFCGENIESNPNLMGNEYSTVDNEPSPRFLERIESMNWIEWYDENGNDRFTLWPVREDYAEHTEKDKLNIIDWINLEEHYMISRVMEDIKRATGKGNSIVAIQKAEGEKSGRGKQFTKDFADVEILLDEYIDGEVLMTMGKVKESHRRVSGRNFAFKIQDGVKIIDFRELRKCSCNNGWRGNRKCTDCRGVGLVG